jgi:hypothetical protein
VDTLSPLSHCFSNPDRSSAKPSASHCIIAATSLSSFSTVRRGSSTKPVCRLLHCETANGLTPTVFPHVIGKKGGRTRSGTLRPRTLNYRWGGVTVVVDVVSFFTSGGGAVVVVVVSVCFTCGWGVVVVVVVSVCFTCGAAGVTVISVV